MLVPHIKDREALENFDELAAVPGISAISSGRLYDLSVSLGVPGAAFDQRTMSAAGPGLARIGDVLLLPFCNLAGHEAELLLWLTGPCTARGK
jgi:hypothetical protein